MDSNFRAFSLAPVTWNILGYSLFCERREKWRVVSRKFQKKNCGHEWSGIFLPIWFGKFESNYPLQGGWRAVDTCLDASRHGIYSPLFTSPSGGSCILFEQSCVCLFVFCGGLDLPFINGCGFWTCGVKAIDSSKMTSFWRDAYNIEGPIKFYCSLFP